MNNQFLNEINQTLEHYNKIILHGFFCDLMNFVNDYSNKVGSKSFITLQINKYGNGFTLLAKEPSIYQTAIEPMSTLINKIKDKKLKVELLAHYEKIHQGYTPHITKISEQMKKLKFLSGLSPNEEYDFLPNQLIFNLSSFTKHSQSQEAQTFAIEIEKLNLEKSLAINTSSKNETINSKEEKVKPLKI